jgi:asparagine synthetase B (glutamine-hydrolysing)
MEWDINEKKITDSPYIPNSFNAGWDNFIEAAKAFFSHFKEKKIGVQLSGGLDSSIIIGLLKYLNIPYVLIGMSSTRYEFRTERYIQKILMPDSEQAVLINYENHLPLSSLLDVPAHQYPDVLSLNFSAHNAMADECNKLGVEVLLTGGGGDNLFADSFPYDSAECTIMPQVFGDSWLTDLVYAPKGVKLIPFYADNGIIDVIYNLRRGQSEDNSKYWARKLFKEILPYELVYYDYRADFWGLYIDGLLNSLPLIKTLFKQAFELTRHKNFSNAELESILSNDLLNAKKELYQVIEARVALAVWLNGLKKTGIAA